MASSSVQSSVSLSSWLSASSFSCIYKLCFYVLKWSSLPKHVAIIMDGNRRYAKKENIENQDGHRKGFNKMMEIVNWCEYLEISEITVYAFSLENFRRTKEEVDTLMDLARERFKLLIKEWEKFRERGVCIRIIGNLTILPKDLVMLMVVSMLLTKDNNRRYLNIAFSYTAKEELIDTSFHIIHGLRQGDVEDIEVTEKFLDRCLYTYKSPQPEIIMRTSGEVRLSDFLTWQGCNSYLHFDSKLWPEFSIWSYISALFCYQHFARSKSSKNTTEDKFFGGTEKEKFINTLQMKRLKLLFEICSKEGYTDAEKICSFKTPDELHNYYSTVISQKL